MKRIAVFASGRGTNFHNLIVQKIPDIQIVLLVTDTQCPALEVAQSYGIEAYTCLRNQFQSKQSMEEHIASILENRKVDFIVLAGYMRLFSPWFVNRFTGRIINIHPSLLPNYKGKHAIQQALSDGKKIYGVSVHFVNEGMDEGEIIAQTPIIYEGDNLDELEQLVHEVEYALYPQVIREICKKENGQ